MEPLKYLSKSVNDEKIALLVLNCPLQVLEKKLNILWQKAVITVAADGAANHLHNLARQEHQFVPNVITGDFDSVEEHVLEYFRKQGTEIVHTPDQDYTDFTKALKFMLAKPNLEYDVIVVLGGMMGSRIDHFFGNFHTLYHATKMTDKDVFLIIDDSVNVILRPGKHTIHVGTGLEGDWCGIIPVGQPCKSITTTGLKWNLDHGTLDFQTGIISTSNTWDGSKVVTVDVSDPVLWTMGVKSSKTE
ncbi:hypothetical protein QZH41_017003 [Actinostola sp. cb2023]|nr:hypothetical protein QZH41_017003 [Actinostola sp. cb2023]